MLYTLNPKLEVIEITLDSYVVTILQVCRSYVSFWYPIFYLHLVNLE